MPIRSGESIGMHCWGGAQGGDDVIGLALGERNRRIALGIAIPRCLEALLALPEFGHGDGDLGTRRAHAGLIVLMPAKAAGASRAAPRPISLLGVDQAIGI
jgi:hypothetical protein